MKSILLAFLMLSLLVAGCTKPPDYPDTPVIEYISNSVVNVNQANDSTVDTLSITFSYTDGDGDLGHANQETKDIILTDGRNEARKILYTLPFIPEQGAGNGVSGEVTIITNDFCCLNLPPTVAPCTPFTGFTDTLSFFIKIVDRAGNESNEIKTDPIFINCAF